MSSAALKVTSHVARDLLHSATLFKHEHSVVWEYVSNGLEYIDPGTQPVVDVFVDAKAHSITVRDNGRGMNAADLTRYFLMHGENIDRKRGKAGRGMFGTGKSAAFGIADTLRITTVKDGRRSKVQLDRRDIEAASDGDSIPVRTIENETPTDEPNGTLVEIEGIHLKKMDVGSIVRHIERHIARWPNATVYINRQLCRVTEPAYSKEIEFVSKGTPFERSLGDVKLIVKVAKAPLESEWQGIAILSNSVWHTSTLAGYDGKPFANYIFGELDIPALAFDKSPIPPFDMSRSMVLNPKNELVAQILAFVGAHIEIVWRDLERDDRERKRERDARKLQEEANAIAKIINQDFDSWRGQVQQTLAKVPGGKDKLTRSASGNETAETLSAGEDIPAIVVDDDLGTQPSEYQPDPEPNIVNDPPRHPEEPAPSLERNEESDEIKAKARAKKKSGSTGGFHVEFKEMGVDSARAKYERDERTIYVNLEHPQIAAARALGGIDDVAFRRLSYEVAFSEYAIALASELAGSDWYHDITDPIYDIRETLNRISRSGASLYSK